MAQYRKKPVVIDAWQVSPDIGSAPAWLYDHLGKDVSTSGGMTPFVIRTLEGDMRCELSDWVICGVKGEVYPIKPDIFTMTYEPAW